LEALSKIRERPPSTLRNINGRAPWEAMTEIRERPLSTLKNINGRPLGGDARDPGAPTINAKKRQQRTPCKVVPGIQECPPSTQKISMMGSLGGGAGDPRAFTINMKNVDGTPLGGVDRNLRASTINTKRH
jgi:hypothetical protein